MAKRELPGKGRSYVRRPDGSLRRRSKGEEEADLARRKRQSFSEAVDDLFVREDEKLSASAVFDRLREALGADSDSELAWIFGMSPQSLANKRRRNSQPYREAVFVSLWANVSLDYLLTGRGSLRSDD